MLNTWADGVASRVRAAARAAIRPLLRLATLTGAVALVGAAVMGGIFAVALTPRAGAQTPDAVAQWAKQNPADVEDLNSLNLPRTASFGQPRKISLFSEQYLRGEGGRAIDDSDQWALPIVDTKPRMVVMVRESGPAVEFSATIADPQLAQALTDTPPDSHIVRNPRQDGWFSLGKDDLLRPLNAVARQVLRGSISLEGLQGYLVEDSKPGEKKDASSRLLEAPITWFSVGMVVTILFMVYRYWRQTPTEDGDRGSPDVLADSVIGIKPVTYGSPTKETGDTDA